MPASRRAVNRFFSRGTARFGLSVVARVVLATVLAPILAPFPADAENASHLNQRLLSPRPGLWLGTDALGRDVLAASCMVGESRS